MASGERSPGLRKSARPALQQQIARAILEAAAWQLARHGDHASMHDIASTAGVARATLYRYFPSRQALLDALADLTVQETAGRLAASRIHDVSVDEGLARAIRALLEGGDAFVVAARTRRGEAASPFGKRIVGTLERLIERGQRSGALRAEVPAAVMVASLVAQVVAVTEHRRALARDDAVALLVDLFLQGARERPRAV